MIPLRRQILLQAFKLFDLLVMVTSFMLATWVAYYQTWVISFAVFLSIRVKIQNVLLFLGFLLVWHLIFLSCGLYRSRRLSKGRGEIADVTKATLIGALFISVMAILFRIKMVTPLFIGVFWVSSGAITILSRLMLRYGLRQIRLRGRNLRHMLMIGTNPRAVKFARDIERKPELGYRLVGFVDEEWDGIEEFRKTGYKLIADFQGLPAYLRDHVVDEAVITLPVNSYYRQASRIANLCEEQGILVRQLSSIFNSKLARSKSEHFEDDLMIFHYTGAMEGWPAVVKRILDISVSLFLILLLLPLLVVTVILIKITSPGPVFFVQERVGLNKRKFRLYKFRTMIPDAERKLSEVEHLNEVSGPVFKIKNDPRIIPIGRLLRKASIDELPQLFNVLKGDMSLVGPRPLPVRDYQGFDKDWHRRRFSVRPGITCLWQVSGRSDIPFEKWMELDMRYIDMWSLGLDIEILAKTALAVLRGSGAA